jgi:hypothetical protein
MQEGKEEGRDVELPLEILFQILENVSDPVTLLRFGLANSVMKKEADRLFPFCLMRVAEKDPVRVLEMLEEKEFRVYATKNMKTKNMCIGILLWYLMDSQQGLTESFLEKYTDMKDELTNLIPKGVGSV